jgi:hypothetical protein
MAVIDFRVEFARRAEAAAGHAVCMYDGWVRLPRGAICTKQSG